MACTSSAFNPTSSAQLASTVLLLMSSFFSK
eukprot:CAMPEP_0183363572 /NCGR_PEP_ID=MMETSP0164_2-20130417/75767_1 /TAXON_ID=221442 /ORGANISM="Coccolithus pelagicus ssp braarudi, Strain PLY182g" /LENGTH=30 /DNA_ID= /DNA_START= /DNA_END= /DNA_ORIENTATION=